MSTDKAEKIDDDLMVSEENDGSATVELPEDMDNPQEDEPRLSEGGSVEDEDHPDDTEAIRAARRNRRRAKKDYIKKTNEEKDAKLQLLERQNRELQERLSVVERKTHGADLARIDKAIEDEQAKLNWAVAKMREATDNSDGHAFTQAQELWYETRRKVEAMRGFKEKAVASTNQEASNVSPQLKKYAGEWMDSNPWYDPNGSDTDSRIAKVIDLQLIEEGYDPNGKDYWNELDRRLQPRLPHRYTDDTDERSSRGNRRRSVVTGSGRENFSSNGSRNQFVLSPEQVRAMKDAGMWDDQQKRTKMIKRYATEARNNRS